MKTFCDFHGLQQLVREPTREEYLLDLVCTDVCGSSVKVLPKIADHKAVLAKLPLPVVLETTVEREVWLLQKANWTDLKSDLQAYDWNKLGEGTAEESLQYFLEILWYHLVKHIPRTTIKNRKSTHPWLNDRSKAAIARKNAAEGTARFEEERNKCMQVLNEERALYVQKTKEKIASLKRSSKKWWRLNRQLLRRKANVSSIPSLKEENKWLADAK